MNEIECACDNTLGQEDEDLDYLYNELEESTEDKVPLKDLPNVPSSVPLASKEKEKPQLTVAEIE